MRHIREGSDETVMEQAGVSAMRAYVTGAAGPVSYCMMIVTPAAGRRDETFAGPKEAASPRDQRTSRGTDSC